VLVHDLLAAWPATPGRSMRDPGDGDRSGIAPLPRAREWAILATYGQSMPVLPPLGVDTPSELYHKRRRALAAK
jgi:hypothetical protein